MTAIDNLLTGDPVNLAGQCGRPAFVLHEYEVTYVLHVPGEVDAVVKFASPSSPTDSLGWPTLKVGSRGPTSAGAGLG